MATPRKQRRIPHGYDGEPVTDIKVGFRPSESLEADVAIVAIFGSEGGRAFARNLRQRLVIDGARIRAEKFGPKSAEIKATLKDLEAAASSLETRLQGLGTAESALLYCTSTEGAEPYDTNALEHELKRLREAVRRVNESLPRAQRSTPPTLVRLARDIADEIRAAGHDPVQTPDGGFVLILELVIKTIAECWPGRVFTASAPHVAGLVLSRKARPK